MTLRVGLIGCGNISDIYLTNAPHFADFTITHCADIRGDAAEAKAAEYGIRATTVPQMLKDDGIDIVLNLTVPDAHAEVSLAAIIAGKHVYTEKPLATTVSDGETIIETAESQGVRVGAAPDTVLGAATQTARRLIDSGAIGKPLMGVAAVLSHGMEGWHPNPAFFFKPGGGPVLDMGPYYVASLVTLLGPVSTVVATGQIGNPERVVTTPGSPHQGAHIQVETRTTVQALLTFRSGAQATLLASWDVWAHTMPHLELHGTAGSLAMPDPNWFGGAVRLARRDADWEAHGTDGAAFGRRNFPTHEGPVANHRGLGLAEMARAIRIGVPHRASGAIGLHVLAVMEAMLASASADGHQIAVGHDCAQPAPLGEEEAASLLRDQVAETLSAAS